eukprot:gene17894-biopygen18102
MIQQAVEHIQPVGLIAVGAGQAAGLDEPGVGPDQWQLPGVAAEQQVFRGFRVVQLGIIQPQQDVAVLEQALQRATVINVFPKLGHDLQAHGRGVLAQLAQQELAVDAIEHADAPGLRQDAGDQAQLSVQRWVAPQQADLRRQRGTQALARLQAADAQHQGRWALGVLQAPIKAGQVQQDQAGAGRQVCGGGQVLERGELHAVFGTLQGQGLDECLYARAVFVGGQQDIRCPCRCAEQ